jgi:SAM-dependent methyltransferase
MYETRAALRDAWQDVLASLGTTGNERVLVAGRNVEVLAEELPVPTADVVAGLAVLGPEMMAIEAETSASATGLADATMDTVAMLSAWSDPAEVGPVVAEAARVVRPGGTVWIGEPDLDVLTRSMPAAYRAGLLYRAHPHVAADVRGRVQASSVLGVEMVRHRLRDVTAFKRDLPLLAVADPDEAVEAVRSGIWPGTGMLSAEELDDLLDAVRVSLQPPIRFPVVDLEPWTLLRGRRAM